MKKLFALLLAVLMLFSFVSCAQEEQKTGEGEQKQTIVVGYTIYEPMNYEENGKLVGFDTELAEAVFAKLGYNVTFKLIDWDQKYTELNAGTINCIWNGFTANTADSDGVARAERLTSLTTTWATSRSS